ncbi:MAG TPA: sigma-54 dependent transcriptional regulator [Verrucomicrobiae bacterium]|nr:sigma-54 dependent transcriptional regulator [Verrucomicrobiae bacterium]
MKALVVDDEVSIRLALRYFLIRRGYDVSEAATGAEAREMAKRHLPDLVFLDQRLPDIDGEQLIPYLHGPEIGAAVIVMTAYVELDHAVRVMKGGAEYFFQKPLDLQLVQSLLEQMEERLQEPRRADPCRDLLLGESPAMIKIRRLIPLLAANPETPVLILGESGTGKEMAARAIHGLGGAPGPLVEINCASLSDTLLESELFGHEKGAFTDARREKPGLFEVASDGSVFLDELGEMPLSVQAKLLRVLDTRTFRRVGGVRELSTRARFLAATNRDLGLLVRQGLFREDLYYRLNVLPLTLPPLRSRGGDIRLLAAHFARDLGSRMGRGRVGITQEALEMLVRYPWPGNVRELRNAIERALILSRGGEIAPGHLPLQQEPEVEAPQDPTSAVKPLWQVEEEHIDHVLRRTGNNISRTASLLGLSRSTLHEKLKKRRTVRNPDM